MLQYATCSSHQNPRNPHKTPEPSGEKVHVDIKLGNTRNRAKRHSHHLRKRRQHATFALKIQSKCRGKGGNYSNSKLFVVYYR